jgi:hypothetical protein
MFDSDDFTLMHQRETSKDRDNEVYQILGGAARMKAMEAFLDLKVPELLSIEGANIAS